MQRLASNLITTMLSFGLAVSLTLLTSCDDFMTKKVVLGATESQSESDDTDSPSDDDDGDGLSNTIEDELGTDSAVADSDHDGFSDGLELVGEEADPLNGSVTPIRMNQVTVLSLDEAVHDATDGDLDGLGDTFEKNHSLNSSAADTDADGFSDSLELINGSDPFDNEDLPEADSTAGSDGVSRTGAAPTDTDSDGIADELETRVGSSASARDTDGDGFSDGMEYVMGSDVNDLLSIPKVAVPDVSAS